MKTILSGMTTALGLPVTTLARMWKIVRTDGVTFYFTAFDKDISFGGNTYLARAGFDNTAVATKSDFTVNNLEVMGIFDDVSITLDDLRAGKFDYAAVSSFLVDWTNPDGNGEIHILRGNLGECTSSPQGWFQVELRGLTQLLQQNILEEYSPVCRADLGDKRCSVPIDPPLWQALTPYHTTTINTQFQGPSLQQNNGAFVKAVLNGNSDYSKYENVIFQCTTAGTSGASQPTFDTTVGHTTVDGSVVWTTVTAWTRDGAVATVIDPYNITVSFTSEDSRDVDGWYQYGQLIWDTGSNAGASEEIKGWVHSSKTVTFNINTGYPVTPGDKFHIQPGCDKTRPTCLNKFANLLNMRAEPDLPSDDYAFYYPNASA